MLLVLLLVPGGIALWALLALVLAIVLTKPAPAKLEAWPSLAHLYLSVLRSAAIKGKRSSKPGKEIMYTISTPQLLDKQRYAAFIRLMHFKDTPSEVPLTYPIVEAFRLTMLSMTHPDFPFNVLGSVLARNSTWMLRPLTVDEPLVHSVRIDPNFVTTPKGHIEIIISNTATSGKDGKEVWRNTLTVIIINPERHRGPSAKAAPEAAPAPEMKVLETWSVPGNVGRAFGALCGDRNPIHLSALSARAFGFKRPIAHALYCVARMEATMRYAGIKPSYPAVLETEFKRPTFIPTKLQCVVGAESKDNIPCAVLTGDGQKPVIEGKLSSSR